MTVTENQWEMLNKALSDIATEVDVLKNTVLAALVSFRGIRWANTRRGTTTHPHYECSDDTCLCHSKTSQLMTESLMPLLDPATLDVDIWPAPITRSYAIAKQVAQTQRDADYAWHQESVEELVRVMDNIMAYPTESEVVHMFQVSCMEALAHYRGEP